MRKESQFLSLILRHAPDRIGLELDPQGWARIDDLLRKMKKAGRRLDRDDLLAIVEGNDKQRFTISADGRRIRAAQGHSIEVDLGLEPVQPPEILYHGTASQSLNAIFADGLRPGRRRQVHLSPDAETATLVGRRHGKPVVLSVQAARMHADGHVFFFADNGVWLTDHVPATYLGFDAIGGITSGPPR